MKCIYCRRDRLSREFSTEHVIPVAFGTFESNLTLNQLVCGDCNQYFGNTVDFAMARGSLEALYRVDQDLMQPSTVQKIRRDRIRIRWMGPGDWHGLILQLVSEDSGVSVAPVRQVGFSTKSGSGRRFVPEEVLQDGEQSLPDDVDLRGDLLLIADSDEAERRLIELLGDRGIPFKPRRSGKPPVRPGQILPVEVTTQIDQLILRCGAKICFNYLAFTQGGHFVLRDEFSLARDFIRFGTLAPYPLVAADTHPILHGDLENLRQTQGHIVTVEWSAEGENIVGQVSLFNHACYRVILAHQLSGVWRDIRSGHHFDIERRVVNRVVGSRLIVPRT